jgi:hypothetical protein
MKLSLRPLLAVSLTFGTLAGCSGADADAGSAPSISNLSYDPAEVKVGAQTTIQGQLAFEDADADVHEVAVEVWGASASQKQALPRQRIQAGAQASGQLAVLLVFLAPAAGDYHFAVHVVDAKGHESNRLEGLVHAK